MQIDGGKEDQPQNEEISGGSDFLVSQNQILTMLQADLFSERICAIWPSGRSMPSVLPPVQTKVKKCVKKFNRLEKN